MKKLIVLFFIGCLLTAGVAFAQEDAKKDHACKYCAMDTSKFQHSMMLITYDDDTTVKTCSIHCAAIEFAINMDKTPKTIMVGDFNAKQLIDAEKAFWVIGGKKAGVMTMTGKWAFENKDDADKFIKENGGKPAKFEDAMKAAYLEMYKDSRMIREKRKMMKKGGGEHKHEHQHQH